MRLLLRTPNIYLNVKVPGWATRCPEVTEPSGGTPVGGMGIPEREAFPFGGAAREGNVFLSSKLLSESQRLGHLGLKSVAKGLPWVKGS